MSKKKRDPLVTTKEIAGTATSVAATVATTLSFDPTSRVQLVIAAVVVSMVPPAVAVFSEAIARRFAARGKRFSASFLDARAQGGKTAEDVERELEAEQEDPAVADVVWRAVRNLMEAPNEAAAPALGVLAGEYTRAKRPADAFFRGVVRLLSELEEHEIAELKELLEWALTSTRRPSIAFFAFADRDGTRIRLLKDTVNGTAEDFAPADMLQFRGSVDADRLFSLLVTNGLARQPQDSFYDKAPVRAAVTREVAERIARLLTAK